MRYLFVIFVLLPNFASSGEISGTYVTTGIYKVAEERKSSVPSNSSATFHAHKCPFDGTVWSHTDASFGNQAAHTCPKCGRVQWIVSAAAVKQAPKAACPNGVCPLQRRR